MGTARTDMENALRAIASMMERGAKAQAKFAPGTAHHTLQQNRLKALETAAALIKNELAGAEAGAGLAKEELEKARAPLASLESKSEKAQKKVAPGSWQHAMLEENLKALRTAAPLLARALGLPLSNR